MMDKAAIFFVEKFFVAIRNHAPLWISTIDNKTSSDSVSETTVYNWHAEHRRRAKFCKEQERITQHV
jgi:hypothetical protein